VVQASRLPGTGETPAPSFQQISASTGRNMRTRDPRAIALLPAQKLAWHHNVFFPERAVRFSDDWAGLLASGSN